MANYPNYPNPPYSLTTGDYTGADYNVGDHLRNQTTVGNSAQSNGETFLSPSGKIEKIGSPTTNPPVS